MYYGKRIQNRHSLGILTCHRYEPPFLYFNVEYHKLNGGYFVEVKWHESVCEVMEKGE